MWYSYANVGIDSYVGLIKLHSAQTTVVVHALHPVTYNIHRTLANIKSKY